MNTSLADEAIALAGSLAEAGVQTVQYRAPGSGWKALAARVTDLPGLIASAPDGAELKWQGGGARVEAGALKSWSDHPGEPDAPDRQLP